MERRGGMLIDFDAMQVNVIPHMRGGEKEVAARMYSDDLGKIMRGRLIPGRLHWAAHP